jgi:hypothetical protein
MTNEESAAGSEGARSPRQGSGNSPVGSTLSIVLAVIAVIAGFLILRNITDDGDSDSGTSSATEAAVDAETNTTVAEDAAGASTTTEPAPSTTFEIVTDGATVVVANANGISGSAGRMSDALEAEGFTMGEPANATVTREGSVVQYDGSIASAKAVADSVAYVMGGVKVTKLPSPPKVEGGDIGGAGVLVLLGENEADTTLKQLQRQARRAETGEAPAPSGTAAADEETEE